MRARPHAADFSPRVALTQPRDTPDLIALLCPPAKLRAGCEKSAARGWGPLIISLFVMI